MQHDLHRTRNKNTNDNYTLVNTACQPGSKNIFAKFQNVSIFTADQTSVRNHIEICSRLAIQVDSCCNK